jgi:hypothetical protein
MEISYVRGGFKELRGQIMVGVRRSAQENQMSFASYKV